MNDWDNRSALERWNSNASLPYGLQPGIGKAVAIARKMQTAPIGEFLLLR